ncbi:MAG: radical SAM protein [bacterium]
MGPDKSIIRGVKEYKPDVIAFSIFTGQHAWAVNLASRLKALFGDDKFIIMGGPHPTFCPGIIENDAVDAICIGEGESAVAELADAISRGAEYTGIKNFWFRKEGRVIRNQLRPLIQDIDAIPFADREIYYGYRFLRESPHKNFALGRGCPYYCAFCFNHALRKKYENTAGDYVRFRSPEKVMEEIRTVKERYPLPSVRFYDDTFIYNRDLAIRFLDAYRKELRIPFYCNVRANLCDEEMVLKLKEAGCYQVDLGVESGNELIRNKILKKGVTDAQIMSAAEILKKHGIRFNTTNMLGLPHETLDDAWKTIQFNIDIKADSAWTSMFQPFPGTEIADYVKRAKLVEKLDFESRSCDAHSLSQLKQPGIREITNLHKFVYLAIAFPFIKPLVQVLIKLRPNPVFNLIYKASYFIFFYRRARKMSLKRSLWEMMKAVQY